MSESPLYLPRNCIVPLRVREDAGLPDGAKIYFGELNVLTHKYGYVYASDEQLAEMKGISERTIRDWHTKLEAGGHIWRDTTRRHQVNPDTGKLEIRTKRKMYVADESGSFSTDVTDMQETAVRSDGQKSAVRSDGQKSAGINNQSLNKEPLNTQPGGGGEPTADADLSGGMQPSSSKAGPADSKKDAVGNVKRVELAESPVVKAVTSLGLSPALGRKIAARYPDDPQRVLDAVASCAQYAETHDIGDMGALLAVAIQNRKQPTISQQARLNGPSWRSQLSAYAADVLKALEGVQQVTYIGDSYFSFIHGGASYRCRWDNDQELKSACVLLSIALDC